MVESDEIDLVLVLKAIINFLNKTKNYLLAFLISGAVIGYVYTVIKQPTYTSSTTVASAYLDNADMNILINRLNGQIQSRNYKKLYQELGLDSTNVKKIKNIELVAESKDKLETKELKNFKINLNVFAPEIIDTLNEGLKFYIKNSDILKLKSETTISKYTKLSAKIDEEITKLELLQVKTIALLNNDSKFFISNFGSINETIVRLYEQNLILKEKLEQNVDYMILERFEISNNPSNKNNRKNSIVGAIGFFVLGLGFLVIREGIKKITS